MASIFIVKLRLSAVDIDRELQALNRSCILVMRSLCDSIFLLAKVFFLSSFFFGAQQKSVFDSGNFQLYSEK